MDIKIKAKLKAYAKGNLPTKVSELENDLDYVEDIKEADGRVYLRMKGRWVDSEDAINKTKIEEPIGNGLDILSFNPDTDTYILKVRQKDFKQVDFENLVELETDTTYYVMDQTANTFDDGGTAFSNGNNEFVDLPEFDEEINGGEADSVANIIMNPLNSEGVYNG